MSRNRCEREPEVVEVLRRGCWSDELRAHVESCSICAETRTVAQMLLRSASLVSGESAPSGAGLVWRQAQARKREIALKRAARPLIYLRGPSVVYMVLFAVWLLHSFWRPGFIELLSGWNVLESERALFAVAIAVLAVAIGAWYLLRDGRRSGATLPSA